MQLHALLKALIGYPEGIVRVLVKYRMVFLKESEAPSLM